MRGLLFWMVATLGVLAPMTGHTHPAARDAEVELHGANFAIGNLIFTIPSRWQMETVDSPARAGQWSVPPLHGDGESGEVVAFFFGPGAGGSAKENIEDWIGTMFTAEGHPADKQWQYEVNGCKISQVLIFGTYNEAASLPGIPPVAKPGYGLLGTVIENPRGNVYWRFTGPEPLLTATLPLFDKMIGSVKVRGTK